jgi:hypothetical protein
VARKAVRADEPPRGSVYAFCRVLIDPATSSGDAVAMLRRIADWIERDGELFEIADDDPFQKRLRH